MTWSKPTSTGVSRPKIETSTLSFEASSLISAISPEKSDSGPETTLTDSPIENCARVRGRSAVSRWSSRSTSPWFKGTPGVTGFVGASNEPVPLTQPEVDRLLHREVAQKVATKAQFQIGESVKVISGPLSDFSGEISEINQDASKLKVLVSIFGRETPVEVGFDQVKKV